MRFPCSCFGVAMAAAALATACEGSHTDLGQDTTSASSTGGAEPSVGGGGAGGGEGGAPPVIVEPDGPASMTVVNGIVDRAAMRLCFLQSPANGADQAEPWPDDDLGYARAAKDPPLPEGDAEVLVLTGDLEVIGAASCREIADAPLEIEGLEVLSIGVLPASATTMPRSLLFALTGCFGGEEHTADDSDPICGPGYSPETPTPGVVIAPLSRLTEETALGIQIVNALGSRELVDGFMTPGFSGVQESVIAIDIASGAVAPFPPSTVFSASSLGSAADANVRIVSFNGLPSDGTFSVGEAMANGGLDGTAFANGKNVALIAVGPSPGLGVGWWNDFAVVAVDP